MQRLKPLSERGTVYISNSNLCNGKGVFANKDIKKDEIILVFHGDLIKADLTNIHSPYALQLDFSLYLLPSGEGKFINHSCEPNCKLLLSNKQLFLIALRDIRKDEELCYNYNTSEYDMGVDAFVCSCNSKNCIKFIKGFKYLSKDQKQRIKDLLLPYLYNLV
ncbi:MAG TPA: SET domain-containing protein [Geobacterales bacterium]|nr:SET domain-containing protein [Geobacterales bacterium]